VSIARRLRAVVIVAAVAAGGAMVVGTVSGVGSVSAVNASTSPHHVVAAGGDHTCVIYGTTAAVRCWGDNTFGQLGAATADFFSPNPKVPGGVTAVVDVAAGGAHTCAALSTGAVKCWGRTDFGQIGNNLPFNDLPHTTPAVVVGLTGVKAVQVAAGFEHSCALLSVGTIRCWGANAAGQLGNNSVVSVSHAVAVSGITGAVAVTAGAAHTCALIGNGTVRCWGRGVEGQLGNNAVTSAKVPVAVVGLSGVVAISAGGNHTCALLATGGVRCWGEGKFGALGNNALTNSKVPAVVAGLTTATAIAAGANHTCARLSTGVARCWGDNTYGQVGDNTHILRKVSSAVAGVTGVTALAGGGGGTCAVLTNATVRCWGHAQIGQLGNGVLVTNHTSVAVSGLSSGVTAIDAGGSHSCAVVSGGVKCWGDNGSGQLGNGTTQYSATPVQVTGLTSGVKDVGTGSDTFGREFSCALMIVGTVKCWGSNVQHQLGVAAPSLSKVPVDVVDITGTSPAFTAQKISVGNEHVCALMANFTVMCWGDNGSDELGDQSVSPPSSSATPLRVTLPGGALALDVAAGGDFTCAVTDAVGAAGAVQCWGNNDLGQVDPNTIPIGSAVPVPVIGFEGIPTVPTQASKVTAGFGHACARESSGDISCWGDDIDGQGLFASTTGHIIGLSASWFHTCVWYESVTVGNVTSDPGGVRCVGQNSDGQLGDGSQVDSPDALVDVVVTTPTVPASQFGATEVSTSVSHTCAVISGGAKCWGADDVGQLGDGKADSAVAKAVSLVAGARQPTATPTVPWAPAAPKVTPGIRSAVLTWTAPANGGKPITDYVVQFSTNGTTWATFNDGVRATTGATVTGLTSRKVYYFRVIAKNVQGAGAPGARSAAATIR
jgi:alpha-tubulin suppressor-like RCC1 family protein